MSEKMLALYVRWQNNTGHFLHAKAATAFSVY